MPTMLTCPKGHQWQLMENDLEAGGSTSVCPICGTLPDMSRLQRERQSEGGPASHDPTVISSNEFPPLPSSNVPVPPIVIPGCEILEEIGAGGMGVVYKAVQQSHDRLVAVKVIRKDRLAHVEAVKRFRREAQAAARLAHPNVVLVYDYDLDGDTHYLIMEFVPGMTLQALVESGGPLDVDDACDFMRQAALGLQHVHEQSLVHRDIKPSNLMVTDVGKTGTSRGRKMLKILDMGVARLFQLNEESPMESLSTLTQPGAVIGTADFIAPEQLEDPRTADSRADLYSLGCTFYYLLVGQVPFPGGSLIQKLDRQRWQTPVAVHQIRPDVMESVSAIIRKLMAKKPADRYQSPAEAASDLEKLAGGGRIASLSSAAIREVRQFNGHDGAVWSVAFSFDGRRMLSGGQDCTLRLWDVSDGKEIGQLPKRAQVVRSVAFSHDGRLALSAGGVSLRIWDVATGKQVIQFMGHSDTIRQAVFSPDGLLVVSCGDDRTVRVWDIGTGRELVRFARHRGAVNSIALSQNGQHVLSGGRGQRLRFWSITNGQESISLKTANGQILGVAVAPNGHYALSAHFDTILRVWDLTAGRELRRLLGHKQMVTSAAFTPSGRYLVSGSKDQTMRIWETDNGAEIACHVAHEGGVTNVQVAPHEPLIVSAGADGVIKLWQLPVSPERSKKP